MKKVIPWILLIGALGMILGFTLQNGNESAALSMKVQQYLVAVLGADAATWWNDYKMFRRLAHVIEYFFLGIAAMLIVNRRGFAIGLCMCVSLADQVVKEIWPMKEFEAEDIPFDAVGYVTGVMVVYGITCIRKKYNRCFQ